MFNNLGVQWAGTLLGCLAAIMIPIPAGFIIFGPRLRAMSRYSQEKGKYDQAGNIEDAGDIEDA
jgi:DHA1 family multidrug resistance protein-like MFS transporter